MEASAQSLRFRRMLGTETLANLVGMLGIDWALVTLFGDMTAATLLRTMGWSGTNPRALSNVFAADALPFRFPFVASPLAETDSLSPNYITWVRTALVDDLKANATPFTTPSVLLFRLLTYAALTECWREGRRILLTASAANATDLAVHELNGIVTGTETRPTPWDYLGAPVPSVTHTMTLGHFLSPIRPGEAARTLPPAITDYRDSLAVLETLPTAEARPPVHRNAGPRVEPPRRVDLVTIHRTSRHDAHDHADGHSCRRIWLGRVTQTQCR